MTLDEFRDSISFLNGTNPTPNLVMYALKKDGNIRFLNVEESVRQEIRETFTQYLDNRLGSEELMYCNLTEYVNTKNTICHYDLNEMLPALAKLEDVGPGENHTEFDIRNENFSDVEAFLFLIGDDQANVRIYKKQSLVSLIKRRGNYVPLAWTKDNELVRLETDVLKIGNSFDFLQVNDETFVMNVGTLEGSMGYMGVITREANDRLTLVRNADIVENLEELENLSRQRNMLRSLSRLMPVHQS